MFLYTLLYVFIYVFYVFYIGVRFLSGFNIYNFRLTNRLTLTGNDPINVASDW